MPCIDVILDESIGTISPNLYGHFVEHLGACVCEGLWNQASSTHSGGICADVVTALKQINAPVIRRPGGCFADDYHWRDGIGPVGERPNRVNIHWGDAIESNAFGTHEFVRFCRAVGAQPYIAGNAGSGSPREMRDWVEYCNFPRGSALAEERAANGDAAPLNVRYWGVGNENWGCGGHFRPEEYAGEYRRFSTYLHDFGDVPLFLVACGPDGNDLDWTRRFFVALNEGRGCGRIHGYAAHYYCGTAGTASAYSESQWYELLRKACLMEELIVQQRAAIDEFDPQRRIGLVVDEWGAWHPPTPGRNPKFLRQQNTPRDALVAALTLDIFNRHREKVVMANIAQAVNVLQALLLRVGGRVIRTPSCHVYDMYRTHQGARSVRVVCDTPGVLFEHEGQMRRVGQVAGSASIKGRTLTLTLVNVKLGEPMMLTINLRGGEGGHRAADGADARRFRGTRYV